MFTLQCPSCQVRLTTKTDPRDRRFTCPKCGHAIFGGAAETSEHSPAEDSKAPPIQDFQPHRPGNANNKWYVLASDGTKYGPISRQELDLWATQGRISSDYKLSDCEGQSWMWAGEIFPDLITIDVGQPHSQSLNHYLRLNHYKGLNHYQRRAARTNNRRVRTHSGPRALQPSASVIMSSMIGYIGGAVILVSLFVPIVKVPLLGGFSYFDLIVGMPSQLVAKVMNSPPPPTVGDDQVTQTDTTPPKPLATVAALLLFAVPIVLLGVGIGALICSHNQAPHLLLPLGIVALVCAFLAFVNLQLVKIQTAADSPAMVPEVFLKPDWAFGAIILGGVIMFGAGKLSNKF